MLLAACMRLTRLKNPFFDFCNCTPSLDIGDIGEQAIWIFRCEIRDRVIFRRVEIHFSGISLAIIQDVFNVVSNHDVVGDDCNIGAVLIIGSAGQRKVSELHRKISTRQATANGIIRCIHFGSVTKVNSY